MGATDGPYCLRCGQRGHVMRNCKVPSGATIHDRPYRRPPCSSCARLRKSLEDARTAFGSLTAAMKKHPDTPLPLDFGMAFMDIKAALGGCRMTALDRIVSELPELKDCPCYEDDDHFCHACAAKLAHAAVVQAVRECEDPICKNCAGVVRKLFPEMFGDDYPEGPRPFRRPYDFEATL